MAVLFATEPSTDDFNSGLIYRAMGTYFDGNCSMEHELMTTRFPDGFLPRPVCSTPCCRVARTLASGARGIAAAARILLMLHAR